MSDTGIEASVRSESLDAVAELVWQFREKHKRGRLPDSVWEQIIGLCQVFEKDLLCQRLGISANSLNSQLQKRKNNQTTDTSFVRLPGLSNVFQTSSSALGVEISIQIPGIASFLAKSSSSEVAELSALATAFLEKCSP